MIEFIKTEVPLVIILFLIITAFIKTKNAPTTELQDSFEQDDDIVFIDKIYKRIGMVILPVGAIFFIILIIYQAIMFFH